MLLGRALPSVQQQEGIEFECLVVSDGPDRELRKKIPGNVQYFELPVHANTRHWGAPARNFGLSRACGDFIAYLDDDDEWSSPRHLKVLSQALLAEPEADFAYSRATLHPVQDLTIRIGDGTLAHGRIQTSMLMHRASLKASWQSSPAEDWDLVEGWLRAGADYVSVGEETVRHYPAVPPDPARFAYAAALPPMH